MRRWISLSHHVTFFLGKRFPRKIPLIFVLGYPKSGTSWACQLTADYMRLPWPQHSIFPIGCAAVVHGHEIVTKKFPLGVYVVRDGRDVVVSAFHHLRSQFEAGGGKGKNNAFFSSINSKAPIKENLGKFIEHSAANPFGSKKHWGDHVQTFFRSGNENMHLLKYEGLLESPKQTLVELFSKLSDDEIDESRLEQSIDRLSFDRLSGRKTGEENQQSYLRKGTRGDWVNHFDQASAAIFHQHFGQALIDAGYEADSSWVQSVSD